LVLWNASIKLKSTIRIPSGGNRFYQGLFWMAMVIPTIDEGRGELTEAKVKRADDRPQVPPMEKPK
jgi:hypothetical protein